MPNNHIHLLGRSLFALLVWLGLTGLIGLPFILGSSPLAVLQVLIYLGVLAGMVWVFRQAENELIQKLENGLKSPRDRILAILIVGLGLAILLVAGYWWAENEKPQLQRLGLLWTIWILSIWLLWAAMYWGTVKRALGYVQPILSGLGLIILLAVGVEGLLRFYDSLNQEEPTVSDVDTRPETWNLITDTVLPWAEQYWLDHGYASREVRWTPYVYWKMAPYDGEYVNIDEKGVRVSSPAPRTPSDLKVHFYGGSTMWGYGSRDEHTIPSEFVAAMDERGQVAEVTNFGEFGYISRQDVTLFDLQLDLGNIPDVAVFYWGFNDVNYTYSEGYVGLMGSEKDRSAQFEGGQCVVDFSLPTLFNIGMFKTALGTHLLEARGIQPVNPAEGCALGTPDWANINTTLVAEQTSDPRVLAEHIAHMAKVAQAIGEIYDVRVVIIWQPSLFQKDPRSWYEEQIVIQDRWRIFGEYYDEVDAEVRDLLTDESDVLIWTDFFHDLDPKLTLFIDKVHVAEEGNALVAAGLADYLLDGAE